MATSTSDLPLAGLTQFRLLTSDEARQVLLDEIGERLDDLSDDTAETTTSVSDTVEADFANRMVDARTGFGRSNPRSVEIYRSTASNWITPYLGDLAVRELASGRLDRYFRRDVPPSRYTDTRKDLHAFVMWPIIQGVLQADAALNLPSYQRQTPRKRPKDRAAMVTDLQSSGLDVVETPRARMAAVTASCSSRNVIGAPVNPSPRAAQSEDGSDLEPAKGGTREQLTTSALMLTACRLGATL